MEYFELLINFINYCEIRQIIDNNGIHHNIIEFSGDLDEISEIKKNINKLAVSRRVPSYNMNGNLNGYIEFNDSSVILIKD